MGTPKRPPLPAWAQRVSSPVVKENEFLLITSMVGHPDKIGDVLAVVGLSDFSQYPCQRLFRALVTLHLQRAKIDAASLFQQAKYAGDIPDLGIDIFGDVAGQAAGHV